MNKKQLKNKRLKDHFLYWCKPPYFHSNLTKWDNYPPQNYIDTFLKVQSYGYKNLTPDELEGITPFIAGQSNKEIFINSLIMECFDFDSREWGWIHPIDHTLSDKMDKLTRLSILRIKRRLHGKRGFDKNNNIIGFGDRLKFYLSHPIRYLASFKSEFDKILGRFNYNKGIW